MILIIDKHHIPYCMVYFVKKLYLGSFHVQWSCDKSILKRNTWWFSTGWQRRGQRWNRKLYVGWNIRWRRYLRGKNTCDLETLVTLSVTSHWECFLKCNRGNVVELHLQVLIFRTFFADPCTIFGYFLYTFFPDLVTVTWILNLLQFSWDVLSALSLHSQLLLLADYFLHLPFLELYFELFFWNNMYDYFISDLFLGICRYFPELYLQPFSWGVFYSSLIAFTDIFLNFIAYTGLFLFSCIYLQVLFLHFPIYYSTYYFYSFWFVMPVFQLFLIIRTHVAMP